MPTTRAMAREASGPLHEKEDNSVAPLRKPPTRRAAAKTAATTQTSRGRKALGPTASDNAPSTTTRTTATRKAAMPLSPKKNVQLPQKRTRLQQAKSKDGTRAELGLENRTVGQALLSDKSLRCPTAPSAQHVAPIKNLAVDRKDPGVVRPGLRVQTTAKGPPGARDKLAVDKKRSKASPRADPIRPQSVNGSISPEDTNADLNKSTPAPHARATSAIWSCDNLERELAKDELCGSTTPHGLATAKEQQQEQPLIERNTPCSARRTPSTTMAANTVGDYFSFSQRVVNSPNDLVSPKRPMSVSRSSFNSTVFCPLSPRASQTNSPISAGPYQWPVTPSPVDERSASPALSRRNRSLTPATTDRTNRARDHLISLFQSDSADDEDEDDEQDEDDDNTDADCQFSRIDGLDFISQHLSTEPAPSERDDTTVMDDEDSFNADHDSSVRVPEIDSTLMRSTPLQGPPILSQQDFDSFMESDDEVCQTPAVHNISDMTDVSIATAPCPKLTLVTARTSTPLTNRRISTVPFKTPRMHSALDEFEDLPHMVDTDRITRRQTVCIDPSLLQHDSMDEALSMDNFQSAHPRSVSPTESLPTPTPELVSAQMAPVIKSPVKAPRLSMFLNTEDLIETPELEHSAWPSDADKTVVVNADDHVVNLQLPNAGIDETVDSALTVEQLEPSGNASTPTSPDDDEITPECDDDSHDLPHYALPTIAYDNRRKSLPLATRTPDQPLRSRGAETAIKPGPTPSFAQVWLHRQTLTPSRRQSMMDLNAAPSPDPATPSSTSIKRPSMLPRSTSTLSLRSRPSLPSLRQDPDTSQSPTPRPRCYTPTSPFASIKLAVNVASGLSRSPFKLHPRPRSPRKASPAKQQAPFTPLPSAPLRGVVALVQVRARSGADASAAFEAGLVRLGAQVVSHLSAEVTHLVFKDGEGDVLRLARQRGLVVVGSRWVADCDKLGRRVGEDDEVYRVGGEKDNAPVAAVGGVDGLEELHDSDEEEWDTPVPVRTDSVVVPGSVPVKRVRKLDLGRRLTAWEESE